MLAEIKPSRLRALVAIAAFALPVAASAGGYVTTGKGIACIRLSLLREAMEAALAGDDRGFLHAQEEGCVIPDPGTQASLLERGDKDAVPRWVRVRLYHPTGATLEFYIDPSGIERVE